MVEEYDKQVLILDFCFLDSDRLFTARGEIEVHSYADFDKPVHPQARFRLPGRMLKVVVCLDQHLFPPSRAAFPCLPPSQAVFS